MTCLFFILTVLHVPVFVMFSFNSNAPSITSIHDALSYFSIANIGQSSFGCAQKRIDVARVTPNCVCSNDDCLGVTPQAEKPEPAQGANGQPISIQRLQLSCPNGGKIKSINEFGFFQYPKGGKQSLEAEAEEVEKICEMTRQPTFWPESSWNIFNSKLEYDMRYQERQKVVAGSGDSSLGSDWEKVDPQCEFNKMFKSDVMKTKLNLYFEKRCVDKEACHVELEMAGDELPFYEELSCECRERIAARETSQHFGIFFQCSSEYVNVQLGRIMPEKSRDLEFAMHRSLALLLYYFIEFVAICFMIRAIIGLRKMNDQKFRSMQASSISLSDYTFQIQNIKLDDECQNLQIFQMKMWLNLLEHLQRLKNGGGCNGDEDGIQPKQQNQKNNQGMRELLQIVDINVISKHGSQLDHTLLQMQVIEQDKNKIGKRVQQRFTTMEQYDQYMAIYDQLQDSYLQKREEYKQFVNGGHPDTWKLKTANETKDGKLKEVEQIYVTLSHRHLLRTVHDKNLAAATVKFQNQSLRVQEASEPDQVRWGNQTSSFCLRRFRGCLLMVEIVIFVAVILALQYYLIFGQQKFEKADLVSERKVCSHFSNWASLDEFKAWAIEDFNRIQKGRSKESNDGDQSGFPRLYYGGADNLVDLGDIACFCKHLKASKIANWEKTTFEGHGQKYFCQDWNEAQFNYFFNRIQYPLIFVILLNGPVTYVISKTVKSVRMRSVSLESKTEFVCVFVFETVAIGLSFFVMECLNRVWIEKEDWYQMIDRDWYFENASSVCIVLVLHMLCWNVFEWVRYFGKMCMRCRDRGCRCNARQRMQDGSGLEDRVWSQQRTQQQLNSLYEGDHFGTARTYARMNSVVFVSLMFAPGFPLFYFLAFLWSLFTYGTQKYMILFFYQRDLTLKKELADASIYCLLFSVLSHMVMGYLSMVNMGLRQSFSRQIEIESQYDDVLGTIFDLKKLWGLYKDDDSEERIGLSIGVQMQKNLNSLDSFIFFVFLFVTVLGLLVLLLYYCCCSRMSDPACTIQKHGHLQESEQETLKSQARKKQGNVNDENDDGIQDDNDTSNQNEDNQQQAPERENIKFVSEKELEEDNQEFAHSCFLNEFNASDLKDFYMRSIFQLYNFKRMFQKVKSIRSSIYEFNLNFSLLEDNRKMSEIMSVARQQSMGNLRKSEPRPSKTSEVEQETSPNKAEEENQPEQFFLDRCQMFGVTPEQVNKYETILSNRVELAEMVINKNFAIVEYMLQNWQSGGAGFENILMNKNGKLPVTRWQMEMTYLEKLNYMHVRHNQLRSLNIIDEGNSAPDGSSSSANIMRMRGSLQNCRVQSYYKFDSREFTLTKKIFYSLEAELVREQDEEEARKYLSFLRKEENNRQKGGGNANEKNAEGGRQKQPSLYGLS